LRVILSVDFEDDKDIEGFLEFVRFHSKRLKCPTKDVFLRLAQEWQLQKAREKVSIEVESSSLGETEKKKSVKRASKTPKGSQSGTKATP